MVGWVFFRADSLARRSAMLRAMAGSARGADALRRVLVPHAGTLLVALAAGVIGSTPVVPALLRRLLTDT